MRELQKLEARLRAKVSVLSMTKGHHQRRQLLDLHGCVSEALAESHRQLQKLQNNGAPERLRDHLALISKLAQTASEAMRLLGRRFHSPFQDAIGADSASEAPAQGSKGTLRLTNREREILQLIAEGLTNREMGERIHLSPKTISTHRQNIMDKLNIHNIAGLTKYAIRLGLTRVDGETLARDHDEVLAG